MNETDFQKLKQEVADLQLQVNILSSNYSEHRHRGLEGNRINVQDLTGFIRTVTTATELTNILAEKPNNFWQQIFIDTSTATKKIYIYDTTYGGSGWKSVAIT